MRLNWSDYKSDMGSRSVRFPGGFTLYVVQYEAKTVPKRATGRWRVTWWRTFSTKTRDGAWLGATRKQVGANELPGLTDVRFATREAAMRAAERVFIPILRVVDEIVDVDVKVHVRGTFSDKPAARARR